MESILTSIKKMLGIAEDYTQFDADIIMHINSVFMTLTQIGVGPSEGFYIEDETAYWTDFVPDLTKVQAIKTYMYLKVRLVFDPASLGSATLASYERQIQELEWRLNIIAETPTRKSDDNITQGTTPTLRFNNLTFPTSQIEECWITLSQGGKVLINKTLSDCVVVENGLLVKLSQDDTLLLTRENTYIQLRVKLTDGNVFASKVICVSTSKLLKDGEI